MGRCICNQSITKLGLDLTGVSLRVLTQSGLDVPKTAWHSQMVLISQGPFLRTVHVQALGTQADSMIGNSKKQRRGWGHSYAHHTCATRRRPLMGPEDDTAGTQYAPWKGL